MSADGIVAGQLPDLVRARSAACTDVLPRLPTFCPQTILYEDDVQVSCFGQRHLSSVLSAEEQPRRASCPSAVTTLTQPAESSWPPCPLNGRVGAR